MIATSLLGESKPNLFTMEVVSSEKKKRASHVPFMMMILENYNLIILLPYEFSFNNYVANSLDFENGSPNKML